MNEFQESQEDIPQNNVKMEMPILLARFFIGATSTILFTIVAFGGYWIEAHKAPWFVSSLVFLVGICNLAGVIFAFSLLNGRFYDSAWTASW